MNKVDLHTHSTFSDGNNTPEEIVISAIEKGMKKIGISDHSFTAFDQSYCIPKNKINNYIACINDLKTKYNDKIEVLLGIEQDYYSDECTKNYDYVIGSVHYVKIDNNYIPVDETADILKDAATKYFQGNIYDLIDLYYHTVSNVISKTNADIIGHIDLISKFNENNLLFDEKDPRYVRAYTKACDKLLETGKVFEINTGAISRGYKTAPYPSNDIFSYLKSKGAKFILSSDSHSKDSLCFMFEKFNTLT